MTVTPHDIGTFLVESSSGREPHLVDLAYVGEGKRKPVVACGCESNFIYGRLCPHIKRLLFNKIMTIKALEVRDAGTFIPVIAVKMIPENEQQRYLLRRSGYGFDQPCVLVCKMSANGISHQASYDAYCWGNCRTMSTAHDYIINHFDELEDGTVVDVEFILKETNQPKVSESCDTTFLATLDYLKSHAS